MKRIAKAVLMLGAVVTLMGSSICFAQDQIRSRDRQQLRLQDQSRLRTQSPTSPANSGKMMQNRNQNMNSFRNMSQPRKGR